MMSTIYRQGLHAAAVSMTLLCIVVALVSLPLVTDAAPLCEGAADSWSIVGGGFHMQLRLPLKAFMTEAQFDMTLGQGLFFDIEELTRNYLVEGIADNGRTKIDLTNQYAAMEVTSGENFDIEIPTFRCSYDNALVTLKLKLNGQNIPSAVQEMYLLVPIHARYHQAKQLSEGETFDWGDFFFGEVKNAHTPACLTHMQVTWESTECKSGTVTLFEDLCLQVPTVVLDILPTVYYCLMGLLWVAALIVTSCFLLPRRKQ